MDHLYMYLIHTPTHLNECENKKRMSRGITFNINESICVLFWQFNYSSKNAKNVLVLRLNCKNVMINWIFLGFVLLVGTKTAENCDGLFSVFCHFKDQTINQLLEKIIKHFEKIIPCLLYESVVSVFEYFCVYNYIIY